jgi:glyoxylase-like metal-dependent hydrolase (beta-lactamase superfamily II)
MAFSDQSLTDAAAETSEFRGLVYPHGRWTPEPGTPHRVAEGVYWLRMPLPFSLDHINLWLLEDGEGWAIVDTGLAGEACRAVWEQLFAGFLNGACITRVFVTHYHPDHIGLAGWLCARFGVPLCISRTEFLYAQFLRLDVRDEAPDEVCSFLARGWGHFSKGVAPLPAGYVRMQAGDTIPVGGRNWRVVIGRGHAPEHVCLVSDEAGVMISGDQVLPRITSNVSVYATEPHANPLSDWFDSLDLLKTLDDSLLVLPSHNEPFRNLHARADQLRADHDSKLDRLLNLCAEPRTVTQTFEALFKRPIGAPEMMMATGEALAHLHYLEAQGRLIRDRQGPADLFIAC